MLKYFILSVCVCVWCRFYNFVFFFIKKKWFDTFLKTRATKQTKIHDAQRKTNAN